MRGAVKKLHLFQCPCGQGYGIAGTCVPRMQWARVAHYPVPSISAMGEVSPRPCGSTCGKLGLSMWSLWAVTLHGVRLGIPQEFAAAF